MKKSRKVNKSSLVCLDSNIFIYYFNQHPQFGPASKIIFDQISNKTIKAIASVITITEILSHSMLSKKDALEMEEKLLDIPNLAFADVNRDIANKAARIRREYKFLFPDALQLATALSSKADVFITNDKRLIKFQGLKVLLISSLLH